jgi:hypothetical protein
MRKLIPNPSTVAGLSILIAISFVVAGAQALSAAAPESEPGAGTPEEATARPQSVFEANHPAGKDPFFPDSSRRKPAVTDPVVPVVSTPKYGEVLKVDGLSGQVDRRLAIINNVTFAEGQEERVRIQGGEMRIRCEKIDGQTVTVTVMTTGERVELRYQGN